MTDGVQSRLTEGSGREAKTEGFNLSFRVHGIPAPWGCDEWEWRAAVAARAREVASTVQHWPPVGSLFTVRLLFYVGAVTWGRADLDNLAKPVLDTLFLPANPQVKDRSLTGALFETDDNRVVRLFVEKYLMRPSEEGVDISIECSPSYDPEAMLQAERPTAGPSV